MSSDSQYNRTAGGPNYKLLVEEIKAVGARKRDAVHAASRSGTLTGTDAWYQSSYDVFLDTVKSIPSTPSDFVRVVAFAYSWVATIPTSDPTPHFQGVVSAILNATRAEQRAKYSVSKVRAARAAAVTRVKLALGIESKDIAIVVASKLLHLWNPQFAPMIDVNISKAWKKLERRGARWRVALSRSGNPRVGTISPMPRLQQYLSYWELAYQFGKCKGGVSYRDLDELMFCYVR